jgi:hypothetical protein
MPELLTKADFAKRRGVGKSAVSNWAKAGLLILGEGEGGRLLVDVMRTEARLNARLDPTRGRPTAGAVSAASPELPIDAVGDGGELTLAGARDLARVRADVAEEDLANKRMRNAQLARELVPVAEAERRLGEVGRMARERVQAELRSRAERLAAEREPRGVMALIDEALDRAFHAVAAAAARGVGAVGEIEEEMAEAA